MNIVKVSFSVSLFQLNCEEDTFQFFIEKQYIDTPTNVIHK